ncbi:hypothetical protein KOXY103107_15970 [Komagataeibacter xylinus]
MAVALPEQRFAPRGGVLGNLGGIGQGTQGGIIPTGKGGMGRAEQARGAGACRQPQEQAGTCPYAHDALYPSGLVNWLAQTLGISKSRCVNVQMPICRIRLFL